MFGRFRSKLKHWDLLGSPSISVQICDETFTRNRLNVKSGTRQSITHLSNNYALGFWPISVKVLTWNLSQFPTPSVTVL